MPKSSEIEGLLSRLEAATGPDREIDARFAVSCGAVIMRHDAAAGFAFFHADEEFPRAAFLSNCTQGEDEAYRSLGQCLSVERYTASIDAALALAERMLPGWMWYVGSVGENDMPQATVTEPAEDCRDFVGHAPTAPVAILIALLRALSARPRP